MRRFWFALFFALVGMGALVSAPVAAQEATPVASPAVAEPSEEVLQPVEITEENGVRTFTVTERPISDAVIDSPPVGDSLGDWLVFSNALYDESNTILVGVDQGFCLRSRPIIGVWECTWTAILANGTVVVQGPFYDNRDTSVFAITGGSGDFAGARGQMTLSVTAEGNFAFAYEITE